MQTITQTQIELYKEYLISEEKSEVTVEKYTRDVSAFSRWLDCGELNKTAVLHYKQELMETYAPTTVNSVLASLNGFFEFNERYDLKVKNLKVQKQIFCQKDKELTKAEYDRLLKAAREKKNERLYLVMQTICSTGIRVSELRFITVDADIEYDPNTPQFYFKNGFVENLSNKKRKSNYSNKYY